VPKTKDVAYFKPRIQKQINNYSRAINKINPGLMNSTMSAEYSIKNIKPGINHVEYIKDGTATKVRYDEITTLSQKEQASLLSKLSQDRYELRQQRALEQLKTKGKISTQFKRSVETQNKKLFENIQEWENIANENDAEDIKFVFENLDIKQIDEEADSYFQGDKESGEIDTPTLFDFFRPGEAGGFSEMNSFTWNIYQQMKAFWG